MSISLAVLYSLYNSSLLGDLKTFSQILFVRWRHPALHLLQSHEFCNIFQNTNHYFHWHSLLDELEQTASQSIKNWISSSSHWHKTTTSWIFRSYKLISQSVPRPDIMALSSNLTCISPIKSHSVSKSCHFHIQDIRRFRHLLHKLQRIQIWWSHDFFLIF